MDWREIGSEVYEYLKGKELEKEKEVAELETRKPSPEMEVSAAIIRATQGDIEWLIELLLSDTEFAISSKDTREWLARVIKNRARRKSKRGRRANTKVQFICGQAIKIFQVWKFANKAAGISDWGLRDQMKDAAARYAINLHREKFRRTFPDEECIDPDFESVRQLMDRPASRQGKRRQNKG